MSASTSSAQNCTSQSSRINDSSSMTASSFESSDPHTDSSELISLSKKGQKAPIIHQQLFKAGIVDICGNPTKKFIQENTLPGVGESQVNRLLEMLEAPRDIIGKKNSFSIKTSIGAILSHIHKNFTKYIENIYLVGGGAPWVLGSDYYQFTLESYGLKDACVPSYLQTELSLLPPDFDIRFEMSPSSNKGLLTIIQQSLIEFIIDLLPAQMDVNKEQLVRKTGFTDFALPYDEHNQFLLIGVGDRQRFEVQFIFANKLQTECLAHNHGLKIPLDSLTSTGSSPLPIAPISTHLKGHQAFFDRLLKKLNVDQVTNANGWITLIHYLSLGYQITNPLLRKDLKEAFQAFSEKKQSPDLLHDLIKHCEEAHPSLHPTGPYIHALNAVYTLADELSPKEVSSLWDNISETFKCDDAITHPVLRQLSECFQWKGEIDHHAPFALLELSVFILEVLQPERGPGIRSVSVTSREYPSLQLGLPTGSTTSWIQTDLSPLKAINSLCKHSADPTYSAVFENILNALLPTEPLVPNPKSAFVEQEFPTQELVEMITPHLSSPNLFLQTLTFYLAVSAYVIKPTNSLSELLIHTLPPLLSRTTDRDRRCHLIETCTHILGESFKFEIEAFKKIATNPAQKPLDVYLIRLIRQASQKHSKYSPFQQWKQIYQRLSKPARDRIACNLLERLPIDRTLFRLELINDLCQVNPEKTPLCLQEYCRTADHLIKADPQRFDQLLVTFQTALRTIIQQTPSKERLEIEVKKALATILYYFIVKKHHHLALEVLQLPINVRSHLLTDKQTRILWEKFLSSQMHCSLGKWGRAHLIWKSLDIDNGISENHSEFSFPALTIYDSVLKGDTFKAVATFVQMMETGIDNRWDQQVKQLFEMIWERLLCRIQIERFSSTSIDQVLRLFNHSQTNFVFKDVIKEKRDRLLESAYSAKGELRPNQIQTILDFSLTAKSITAANCTPIVILFDHLWEPEIRLSNSFLTDFKKNLPFIVTSLDKARKYQTLLKLLFTLNCFNILRISHPTCVNSYFRTISYNLNRNLSKNDFFTLNTILHTLQRISCTKSDADQTLILKTCILCCERLIKIKAVEKALVWMEVLFTMTASTQEANLKLLIKRHKRWLLYLKGKQRFTEVIAALKLVKKHQFSEPYLKELFTEDFIREKCKECASFLLKQPLSKLHSQNSDGWTQKAELLVSLLLEKKEAHRPSNSMLLQLLLQGKVSNGSLWYKSYQLFMQSNSIPFKSKAFKVLITIDKEGILNSCPQKRDLCWELCLETPNLISDEQAAALIATPKEFAQSFPDTESATARLVISTVLLRKMFEFFGDHNPTNDSIINIAMKVREGINTQIAMAANPEIIWKFDLCIINFATRGWYTSSYFGKLVDFIIDRLKDTPDKTLPKEVPSIIREVLAHSKALPFKGEILLSITKLIDYTEDRFIAEPWFPLLLKDYLYSDLTVLRKRVFEVLPRWAEQQLKPETLKNKSAKNYDHSIQWLCNYLCDLVSTSDQEELPNVPKLLDNAHIRKILPYKSNSQIWGKYLLMQLILAKYLNEKKKYIEAIDYAIYAFPLICGDPNTTTEFVEKMLVELICFLDIYKDIPFFTSRILKFLEGVERIPAVNSPPKHYLDNLDKVFILLKNHGSQVYSKRPALLTIYNCLDKMLDREIKQGTKNIERVHKLINSLVFDPIPEHDTDFSTHDLLSKKLVAKFKIYAEKTEFVQEVQLFETFFAIKANFRSQTKTSFKPSLAIAVFNRMAHTKSPYHAWKVLGLIEENLNWIWEEGKASCKYTFEGIFELLNVEPFAIYQEEYIIEKAIPLLLKYFGYLIQSKDKNDIDIALKLISDFFMIYYNQIIHTKASSKVKLPLIHSSVTFLEATRAIGVFKDNVEIYLNHCEEIQKTAVAFAQTPANVGEYYFCAVRLIRNSVGALGTLSKDHQRRRAQLLDKWLRGGINKKRAKAQAAQAFNILYHKDSVEVFKENNHLYKCLQTFLKNKIGRNVKAIIFQQQVVPK